ncbi:MAG: glycosyltransferase [Nitrospira sp.]|nr:glycosyltransferase [Nitrospira sp.]
MTRRRDPFISVVMGVHNGRRHLPLAVESILRQSRTDFEFIIVDDGSQDGAREILEEFAGKDPRIRLVSRDHRGLTVSLNEGLRLAQGELIARMDADDVARVDRLAKQANAFQLDPELVAMGSWALCIEDAGRPVFTWRPPRSHEEIDADHIAGRTGRLIHPTAMMRRAAVDAVGGYDETFETAQDLDLWLRLAERGRLANLTEPLLDYRLGLGAVTQRRRERQLRDALNAVARARTRRGLPPLTGEVDPIHQTASTEAFLSRWITLAINENHLAAARALSFRLVRTCPNSKAAWRRLASVLFRSLRGAMNTTR